MEKIHDFCVRTFVTESAEKIDIDYYLERKCSFKNFPFVLQAVDITFQQSNRPSGNMQEGKVYFFGKHKLYSFKFEVAVRANGVASAFSKHYSGSASDITILSEKVSEDQTRLEKPMTMVSTKMTMHCLKSIRTNGQC